MPGPPRLLLLALLLTAALAAVAPAGARAPRPQRVTVGDDFFSKTKLRVPPGTTITWHWDNNNQHTHDVRLKSGPRRVRKFVSESGAAYVRPFRWKFVKKGTYRIYCSFHVTVMRMTVVVR